MALRMSTPGGDWNEKFELKCDLFMDYVLVSNILDGLSACFIAFG